MWIDFTSLFDEAELPDAGALQLLRELPPLGSLQLGFDGQFVDVAALKPFGQHDFVGEVEGQRLDVPLSVALLRERRGGSSGIGV